MIEFGGRCRDAVHAWRSLNKVELDPSKEHLVLLHPQHGSGKDFLLPGCPMDVKLIMRAAVAPILTQIRPNQSLAKNEIPARCEGHDFAI